MNYKKVMSRGRKPTGYVGAKKTIRRPGGMISKKAVVRKRR